MVWLRSKAKRLSLLALFALAVQFGLSFGHVHIERAFAAQTTVAEVTAANPHAGGDADGNHDVCAICATISLANTLIDSAPPALPVPAQTAAAEPLFAANNFAASPPRAGFQSRAPPLS